MELDYYAIGQRIRKYRKAKRMSQETLAEKTDISVTHMSHIETGNTKLSLQVFADLARALDISADDLLCDFDTGRNYAEQELSDMLDTCTTQQVKIITEVAKATKIALDKYEKNA
ncbi:MAG: helix-turn-helix domain-containing protein [Clostridia bacterium]|nr:helix-turn-helix domain-containing protein [Clostridia bacterium]